MNKKQNLISQSWLYVILILLCLFGAVSLMSTLETNKVKREQVRIYNRINNMERALTTKDKEIESYLIKEAQKWHGLKKLYANILVIILKSIQVIEIGLKWQDIASGADMIRTIRRKYNEWINICILWCNINSNVSIVRICVDLERVQTYL